MKAELLGALCMHVLVFSVARTDEYNIPGETTWTVASNSCKLATPRFSYSNEYPNVSIDLSGRNATMWVGYVKLYHMFETIGCVAASLLNGTERIQVYYHPGLCFAACGGGKFFGVAAAACYCFNNSLPPLDTNNYCTNRCLGKASARCGGYDPDDHESVVSLFQEVGMSASEEGICRSYEPSTRTFLWEVCENDYSPLCNGTGITVTHKNVSRWNEAVRYCFKHNMYPLYNITSLPIVIGQTYTGSRLWTAMFRTPVIHAASGNQYAETPGVQYGYIGRQDSDESSGKYVLHFTDSTTEKRISLCNIESDAGTDEETTTDSALTTTYVMQHGTDRHHGNSPTSSQVGSYVGIAVGVIVTLLIIGAVAIFFTRRRKRKRKEDDVSKTSNNYDTQTTTSDEVLDKQVTDNKVKGCDISTTTPNQVVNIVNVHADESPAQDYSYAAIPTHNQNILIDSTGKHRQNAYYEPERQGPAGPKRTPGNQNVKAIQHDSERKNAVKPNQAQHDSDYSHTREQADTADMVYAEAYGGHQMPPITRNPNTEQQSQKPQRVPTPTLHDTSNVYDITSSDDNNVYDVSGDVPKKTVQSDNVYSTAQFRATDGDDTYDRTWGTNGNQPNAENESWNIYNTANVKDNIGDDSMYDSTLQAQCNQQPADPLYSHATLKP